MDDLEWFGFAEGTDKPSVKIDAKAGRPVFVVGVTVCQRFGVVRGLL